MPVLNEPTEDDLKKSPVVRNSLGQFPAGVSGHPGGRTPAVVLAARAKLATHLDEAITLFVTLMRGEDKRLALAAACEIRDTVMGRPKPTEVDTEAQVRAELQAVFAQLREKLQPDVYKSVIAELAEGAK